MNASASGGASFDISEKSRLWYKSLFSHRSHPECRKRRFRTKFMLILSLLIAVAQISSKLLRAPQYCVQLTYTLNAYCRTSQKALENRSRVLRKPFQESDIDSKSANVGDQIQLRRTLLLVCDGCFTQYQYGVTDNAVKPASWKVRSRCQKHPL